MDSEHLGTLIDRHAAALELYARQWCDEAEDVVQEVFVRLAGLGTPPVNAVGWLFRAVRNGAINAGIKRKRRLRHEAKVGERARGWFREDDSGQASGAVDSESAQVALSTLPLEQREVIVAHLWGGLTFEQVAELSGSSASTAHRVYQTGMNALRERLGVTCRENKTRPASR
jgi:RNA polymerase sigma factor (sigma-70 family)